MNKFEDPSLSNGYSQIDQVQKPFKLDNKLKNFEDTFMARIFKSSHAYKIELTSENNVSFLYKSIIDSDRCSQISNANSINLEYSNLASWLKHMFHDELSYEFIIEGKSDGHLKVFKTEEFKIYELATIPFHLASEEQIRQNLMFRYYRMKVRRELLIQYWAKMQNIIKTKNPSLLLASPSSYTTKKAFK